MKFHHLFADASGESHWVDVDVPLAEKTFAPPAAGIHVSVPQSADAMVFLRLPAGWDEPIHPTPCSQTLICLSGWVRVTASDGEARQIGPGDVWRMDDIRGKGHHTCVIGDTDFDAVIVQHG